MKQFAPRGSTLEGNNLLTERLLYKETIYFQRIYFIRQVFPPYTETICPQKVYSIRKQFVPRGSTWFPYVIDLFTFTTNRKSQKLSLFGKLAKHLSSLYSPLYRKYGLTFHSTCFFSRQFE